MSYFRGQLLALGFKFFVPGAEDLRWPDLLAVFVHKSDDLCIFLLPEVNRDAAVSLGVPAVFDLCARGGLSGRGSHLFMSGRLPAPLV